MDDVRAFEVDDGVAARVAGPLYDAVTSSPAFSLHVLSNVASGYVGAAAFGLAAATIFISSGTFACATSFFASGLNTPLPPVWSA